MTGMRFGNRRLAGCAAAVLLAIGGADSASAAMQAGDHVQLCGQQLSDAELEFEVRNESGRPIVLDSVGLADEGCKVFRGEEPMAAGDSGGGFVRDGELFFVRDPATDDILKIIVVRPDALSFAVTGEEQPLPVFFGTDANGVPIVKVDPSLVEGEVANVVAAEPAQADAGPDGDAAVADAGGVDGDPVDGDQVAGEPAADGGGDPAAKDTRTNPAGDPEPDDVMRGTVEAHNKWRAEVGTPPLVWSQTLADYAQEWADNLAAKHNCELVHRDTGPYGENLAGGFDSDNGQTTTDFLAEEKAAYDFDKNQCKTGQVCGHYVQIIWRNTREVGCARANCPSRKDFTWIWVCNYNPGGADDTKFPF